MLVTACLWRYVQRTEVINSLHVVVVSAHALSSHVDSRQVSRHPGPWSQVPGLIPFLILHLSENEPS